MKWRNLLRLLLEELRGGIHQGAWISLVSSSSAAPRSEIARVSDRALNPVSPVIIYVPPTTSHSWFSLYREGRVSFDTSRGKLPGMIRDKRTGEARQPGNLRLALPLPEIAPDLLPDPMPPTPRRLRVLLLPAKMLRRPFLSFRRQHVIGRPRTRLQTPTQTTLDGLCGEAGRVLIFRRDSSPVTGFYLCLEETHSEELPSQFSGTKADMSAELGERKFPFTARSGFARWPNLPRDRSLTKLPECCQNVRHLAAYG